MKEKAFAFEFSVFKVLHNPFLAYHQQILDKYKECPAWQVHKYKQCPACLRDKYKQSLTCQQDKSRQCLACLKTHKLPQLLQRPNHPSVRRNWNAWSGRGREVSVYSIKSSSDSVKLLYNDLIMKQFSLICDFIDVNYKKIDLKFIDFWYYGRLCSVLKFNALKFDTCFSCLCLIFSPQLNLPR